MENAIVLGGTGPHVMLVEKLKARGFHVILADYLPFPVAKNNADEHIQISTLDKEAVLALAQKRHASLVVSTCIDQANATACYVAEKMGLPRPYDYETAVNVTDKVRMKEIMIRGGIPTSRFCSVDSVDALDLVDLHYPLIVKPVDCNSSKGITRVDNKVSLSSAILKAVGCSRTHNAIVEEFVCGTEVGIDCFVTQGCAKVLMIKERRKIVKNNGGIQQIFGCTWPLPGYEKILEVASSVAQRIALAFGLVNSALMIQAILKDDGSLNVIEFGARIGGGESFRIIKSSTGFDYVEAAINTFTGECCRQVSRAPDGFFADNFIYSTECTFGELVVPDRLMDGGVVEYWNSLRMPGAKIGGEISSNNRVGVVVAKSQDPDELQEKIQTIIRNVEVYDINHKPVMRHDIY